MATSKGSKVKGKGIPQAGAGMRIQNTRTPAPKATGKKYGKTSWGEGSKGFAGSIPGHKCK